MFWSSRSFAPSGRLLGPLLATLLSCEPAVEDVCVMKLGVHGADDGALAALSPITAAIGRLETAGGDVRCTASLLAPGWLLTARHCHDELSLLARFVVPSSRGELSLGISLELPHPDLDVMLVRVRDDDLAVSPLMPWQGELDSAWLGEPATLVGYGDDERGERGTLRAVREPIVDISEFELTTDGQGRSGACGGDSGGPLLLERAPGVWQVVGVLSKGDASCKGLDRYTRVDALGEWVAQAIADAEREPCAGLSEAGHCERNVAVYCHDGWPQREACAGHRVCGWDTAARGARCVGLEADPCHGSMASGACEGNQLLTCRAGALSRVDCGACSQCRRAASGAASCD